MKSGLKPTRIDHRDRDFHRSFGSVVPPSFPTDFSVESGLWTPNQETTNITQLFTVQPEPYGCTNFTQADLCADQDTKLYDPTQLEAITHANASGGADIRTSLKAAEIIWNRTAYYNIQPVNVIDAFDAARLAILSSEPEKRSVSIGTPWFPEWEGVSFTGVLPVPVDFDVNRASWHNHKINGWKTIDGQPYLVSKSWQGSSYGDKGYVYFSRSLFNSIMAISGTAMFTTTKLTPTSVQTVPVNIVQWIVSLIRNLFNV